MKSIFNDAEGTVKMLIRDDLFAMVEKDLAQAWKKVTTKNADEEFSNMKGKGKGKGKGPTSRGIQDYLYNVHLVKVSPNETDFDEEDLRDAAAAQAHRRNTDFDTKPKLYQSNFCKTNRRSAVLDTKTILQTLTWIQAEKL